VAGCLAASCGSVFHDSYLRLRFAASLLPRRGRLVGTSWVEGVCVRRLGAEGCEHGDETWRALCVAQMLDWFCV
jgi:hypothetical protein